MSVEVRANGKVYRFWKRASVTRGMEQLAGTFELEVMPGQDDGALLELQEGTACRIALDGETVIDGYIDHFSAGLELSGRTLRLSGRDKTCDLVDCTAQPPNQYLNQSPERILASLLAPFGVPLVVEGDLGAPFASFAIEPGETVHEAVVRLCRARGFLPIADRRGGLRVLRPASVLEPVAIEEGENVKAASADYDASELFSAITVKGQSAGTKDARGRIRNGAAFAATDPRVQRFRPLVVIAQGQATAADCQRQALWEMASRNGKALKAEATLYGWRQAPGGKLWDIDQLVRVELPSCYVDEPLLVVGVTYTLDAEGGSEAKLSLLRREAMLPEPIDPSDASNKKAAKGRKKKKKGQGASGPELLPLPQYRQ